MTQARNALARKFPLAQNIECEKGVWYVSVGDEYYEEIYSYTVKGSELVYVGMTVIDAT